MSTDCPRCGRPGPRREHEGREDGELLWTVWHCNACSFTWRASEPAESIDPEQRPAWFAVDPDDRARYHHNIPPARER